MNGTLKRFIVSTGLLLLSVVSMSALAQIDVKPDYQVDITASNSPADADTFCAACDEGQGGGQVLAYSVFEVAMPVLSGAVELTHHNDYHAHTASVYAEPDLEKPLRVDKHRLQ